MINFDLITYVFSVVMLAITFAVTTIIPVISSLLILLSNKQPIKKGLSFLFGFYIGLLVLFVLIYFFVQYVSINFGFVKETLSNSLLNFVLGVILIIISFRFFRNKKNGKFQNKIIKIFDSIEDISLKKHAFISAILIVTAPKNWILIYIALTFLLKINFGIIIDLSILAIYLVASSIFLLIPIILRILFGKKIESSLDKFKDHLINNSNKIIGFFLLIAGILIIFISITGYHIFQ